MDDRLITLYNRLGPRYIWVPVLGAIPFNLLATVVAVAAAKLYFEGSAREWIEILATAGAISVACILVTFFSFRNYLEPVFRWAQGDRDEATAAATWNTLTSVLFRIIKRGVIIFCIPYVFFPLYIMWRLQLRPLAYVGLVCSILIVIIWSAALIHLWIEWAFRPILIDVSEVLPWNFEPGPGALRARHKLLAAATIFATANILFVGAIPYAFDVGPAEGIILFVGAAVTASLTVAFVGNTFLVRSMFDQVDDLMTASASVAAGDLTTRVPLLSGDEFGNLGASFNRMVHGLAEREALRSALGSYVDPVITERLLSEGELLEGEEVEVTVLFLDLRGFTTLAESQSAQETVAYLNDLFSRVVPLVAEHGGHVNKFTGDGLLAVFGAPEQHENHADRAVAAAVAIVQAHDASETGPRIAIGLNTGNVVVGTIGGGGHLEFAVIGDVVNVAARVQELTKETGDAILMTSATHQALSDADRGTTRGSFSLRGRNQPLEVYALEVTGA